MSASTDARLPAVVIDCGTGYTKMGYAGNSSPNYIRARAHRSPIAAIPRARRPRLAPLSSARQSLTSPGGRCSAHETNQVLLATQPS